MSTERYVPMCMRMVCVHYYLDGIPQNKVPEEILGNRNPYIFRRLGNENWGRGTHIYCLLCLRCLRCLR